MKVFLSHSHNDKDAIEAIGSALHKKGLDVWIDSWRMTAGDSLIDKIGEGIESSDRLLVFLSPHSVDSNWVRKEVATGLVMELAEEKGLGTKFVIPALLVPCKVPVMLRDKLYANFTNKAFETACEELYRGIMDQELGHQDKKFENRIVRTYSVSPKGTGKYGLIIEFAVRITPTEGLHIGIDVGVNYKDVEQWFFLPNNQTAPSTTGGMFYDSAERREPPIYARKFSNPGVTSTRSFYVYFEADEPFNVKEVKFLDFYDQEP